MRPLWLFVIAAICFFVALAIALGVDLGSSTYDEWLVGGLFALAIGEALREPRAA